MVVNEEFLLWSTEANKENMRLCRDNAIKNILERRIPFFESNWWATDAGNLDSGVTFFEELCGVACRFRHTAEQEDAQPVGSAAMAELLDQADSGDAAGASTIKRVARPDDGHAVGADVVGIVQALAEAPGFLREHIELSIGCDELASGIAKEAVMQDFVDQRGF